MSDTTDAPRFVRFRGRTHGPYTDTELARMVKRGQITRMHELSADRMAWSRAGEDAELFPENRTAAKEGAWEETGEVENQAETATQSANSAEAFDDADPDAEAHYDTDTASMWFVELDGERYGPLSSGTILQMYNTSQLTSSSLVWREGTEQWVALSQSGLLGIDSTEAAQTGADKGGGRWLVIGAIAAAVVLTIGIGVLVVQLMGPGRTQALGPSQSSLISSVQQSKEISGAVGLVVCGFHTTEPDGRQVEVSRDKGSCFFINPTGHVITNRHVVEEVANLMNATALLEKIRREQLREVEPRIWVFVDGEKFDATPVFVHRKEDFAILKIERANGPCFALAKSNTTTMGQTVHALGYPEIAKSVLSVEEFLEQIAKDVASSDIRDTFKERDFVCSLTKGVISRQVDEQSGRSWIEHEATIRGGNSGGPLVGDRSTVVGINTARQVNPDAVTEATTNMALEISQLREVIDQHAPGVTWK